MAGLSYFIDAVLVLCGAVLTSFVEGFVESYDIR
jgi:hypothetical protein